jgi:hypothetical protein
MRELKQILTKKSPSARERISEPSLWVQEFLGKGCYVEGGHNYL